MTSQQIADFMTVLFPIQSRLFKRYGYSTVNGWRQARLNRPKEQITPEGF